MDYTCCLYLNFYCIYCVLLSIDIIKSYFKNIYGALWGHHFKDHIILLNKRSFLSYADVFPIET